MTIIYILLLCFGGAVQREIIVTTILAVYYNKDEPTGAIMLDNLTLRRQVRWTTLILKFLCLLLNSQWNNISLFAPMKHSKYFTKNVFFKTHLILPVFPKHVSFC